MKSSQAATKWINTGRPQTGRMQTKDPSKFLIFTPVNAIDGKKLADAKEAKQRTPAQQAIVSADQTGDRKTLKADSVIPAIMAVIYLALLLYFKSIGGYKAVHLEGTSAAAVKS